MTIMSIEQLMGARRAPANIPAVLICHFRHGAVCRMTLAELQDLDAGEWFNKKYTGVHVPTLHEVHNLHGLDRKVSC